MPIVLSLFIPYLLGLGFLLIPLFPGLFAQPLPTREARAGLLALVLAFGILLNFLLTLLLGELSTAFAAGSVLSLVGLGYAGGRLRGNLPTLFALGGLIWGVFLYLLLLYTLPIVLSPISSWDARSIWFFHGKMIYYSRGLSHATGLDREAVQFSHTDYPMLLPALSAQFAYLVGYWNEFLPKASLLVLLVPALLGALSFFARRKLSSLFLIGALFFSLGWMLWDGYMDGYLALWSGLSVLFLGRWLEEKGLPDLLAGILFLGVVMSLKNEGMLFAVSIVCALGPFLVLSKKGLGTGGLATIRNAAAAGAVPLLCALLWGWKKASWGLANDLQLGPKSLPRIQMHLAQGGFGMIGRYLLDQTMVGRALLLLVAAVAAAALLRVRLRKAVWFSVATALVYFCGIYLVYLSTFWDLMEHLKSSADRVMAPVIVALSVAVYFILHGIEVLAKRASEPAPGVAP